MRQNIGSQIYLREYRLSDADEMYKWRNDSNTTKWMGKAFRKQVSLEYIQESLNKTLATCSKESLFYVIADKKTDNYIGGICLTAIDWTDKIGDMSIVIGNKNYRNRGIGTEATDLLLKEAFKVLKLHKIELNVYKGNISALNCYKKCGFKIEGERREHMLIDGNYHNLIQLGILDREYFNK